VPARSPDSPSPTLSVADAARLLGTGQAVIRSEITRSGTCAGVRVLRVGPRGLIRIPAAPLRRALGLDS
jgi:hypothetical protein